MKKVWISNEVLNWDCYYESAEILEKARGRRAYKIWEHAKQLIESNETEFYLADGITNLKRALNQRLQYIEELYDFKSININNKPKGYLELLEIFGVVRPFLMKQLFEIRNDIEHRDATPPSIQRCTELLDVVWYFLKSTDTLVQLVKDYQRFDENKDDESHTFTIEYIKKKDVFIFEGKIPEKFVSEEYIESSFEVRLGLIDGVENRWLTKVYGGQEIFEFSSDNIIGEAKLNDLDKVLVINKILFEY